MPNQRRGDTLRDVAEVGAKREPAGIVDEVAAEREHGVLHSPSQLVVRAEPADDRIARPEGAGERLAERCSELAEPRFLVGAEQEVDAHRQLTALLDVALELDVLDDRVGRRELLHGVDRATTASIGASGSPCSDRVPVTIARSRRIHRDCRKTVSSNSGCAYSAASMSS
jgi:hypothetical protein